MARWPNACSGVREAAAIDTDAFYRQSCERDFVQREAIARNVVWTTPTRWGDLEITINLSKPEKDPAAIAAAAAPGSAEPARADGLRVGEVRYIDGNPAMRVGPCQLCVSERDVDLGYAKRIELGGEPWGMWYSPYAYYDEHCIAMCWEHRPMHVDRKAFDCLFDFADLFPRYFIGSNADLPIVGASILAHDHFQGGWHVFPLQVAPVAQSFELPGYEQVEAGVVEWPLTVLRLSGADRAQLIDAACHILDMWRTYGDASAGVLAETDGELHNTITPMLRKAGTGYQLDLALRCNITSAEHPLGVFHPHERLHHIKRENIGLIEVMGRAILPPRVSDTMRERGLSRDDVGRLFAEVLECAGVFKWDAAGRAALDRFLNSL